MPNKNRLIYLFKQYLSNEITDSELEELLECIEDVKSYNILEDYVDTMYQETQANKSGEWIDWDTMFNRIVHESVTAGEAPKVYVKRVAIWRNIAASVVVLIIGIGAYLYFHQPSAPQDTTQQEEKRQDIMPGGNKAVLTLVNGQKIVLDSSNIGLLSMQGNTKVIKLKSGSLAYRSLQTTDGEQSSGRTPNIAGVTQYNTLAVPLGGTYQLTLSDGTKVWLNAGSTIRYPIAFNEKERKVNITGEAYFEVAHNEKLPFKVSVDGEVIEDLGTRFNVNAYADEPAMKVTLLEGAVKVRNKILEPGEQALIKDNNLKILKEVNVSNVVAWKEGYFAFDNATLAMVMRKLARWYDIKVIYKQGINSNKQSFSGRIGRNLTLSQVLTGLRQTKAHFKIKPDRKTVILQ